MNYQEFKEVLIDELLQRLEGTGIELIITHTVKNNMTEKEVLTFKEDGINGMPAIHLKDLFKNYEKIEIWN